MDKDFHALETYIGTNCANATNIPCCVPQIKDIVKTQHNLDRCPTVMDYNCERMVLYYGLPQALGKCRKPCENLQYSMIERDGYKILKDHMEQVSMKFII